jgi:hypothetical protein
MGNWLLPLPVFFVFLSFFVVLRTARMRGSFADISVPAHVFHGFTFAEAIGGGTKTTAVPALQRKDESAGSVDLGQESSLPEMQEPLQHSES